MSFKTNFKLWKKEIKIFYWKIKIFLRLSVLYVLNFGVTLAGGLCVISESERKIIYLWKQLHLVSQILKYASTFFNKANTILITRRSLKI